MAECFKCSKPGEEVKLLDVILDDEIVKVCGECFSNEDFPVIKKPTTSQLKESERPYTVKERLRRIQGLRGEEKEEISKAAKKLTDITLDDLYRRKKEKEFEEKFELTKKMSKPLNLVDNFHWYVFIARRKRKLTRKEVASLLGESETPIKMIENKELPDDSLILINKLEQFFGIKLKKYPEEQGIGLKKEKKKKVPEKIELKSEKKSEKAEIEELENKDVKEPARILKFDKNSMGSITIGDLQKIKERREEKQKLGRQRKMDADELLTEMEKEQKTKETDKWKQEAENNLIGEIELE